MIRYFRAGLPWMLAAGMLWTAVLFTDALAQQGSSNRIDGLALSGDQPIQIESDKLQVQDEQGTATFIGNVKVVQGNTLMQTGHMTVHYARNGGSTTSGTSQIDRIDVKDKVYIKSDDQEATADQGVFDMKAETLELTGKQVVLSQGNNVFVGCKLIVFVKTGEAKLESGSSCGRVKIQLDPKSRN